MLKYSGFRVFARYFFTSYYMFWTFECCFQDLLDVADVLNKAISSVPREELGQSQSLTDLHQGLQLTESQLLKVCKPSSK